MKLKIHDIIREVDYLLEEELINSFIFFDSVADICQCIATEVLQWDNDIGQFRKLNRT